MKSLRPYSERETKIGYGRPDREVFNTIAPKRPFPRAPSIGRGRFENVGADRHPYDIRREEGTLADR